MTDTQDDNFSGPETPILIVDDNPQYTKVLSKILEAGFGYHNITTAESTREAYELVEADPSRFRLMFVDYNFPSGDSGGELLHKLREREWLTDKVAFLITSEPTVDNMSEAMAAGAMGVVAKPFDRNDLRKQLDKARQSFYLDNTDSF